MKTPPSKRTYHNQGFSLVEVTLALGVVAFALIAVVGLVGSLSSRTQAVGEFQSGIEMSDLAVSSLQRQSRSNFSSVYTDMQAGVGRSVRIATTASGLSYTYNPSEEVASPTSRYFYAQALPAPGLDLPANGNDYKNPYLLSEVKFFPLPLPDAPPQTNGPPIINFHVVLSR